MLACDYDFIRVADGRGIIASAGMWLAMPSVKSPNRFSGMMSCRDTSAAASWPTRGSMAGLVHRRMALPDGFLLLSHRRSVVDQLLLLVLSHIHSAEGRLVGIPSPSISKATIPR